MHQNDFHDTLTPRGFLALKLLELGLEMDEFPRIWDELAEFTRERAVLLGMEDGTPCLVLEGPGHCLTVRQLYKNGE